jgi:hypothetical protein
VTYAPITDDNARVADIVTDAQRKPAIFSQLWCVAVIVLVAWYWHTRVTLQASVITLVLLLLIGLLALAYGDLFLRLARPHLPQAAIVPFQFLCGYCVISTLLFVFSVITPLGAASNFLVLIGGAATAMLLRPSQSLAPSHWVDHLPAFICVAVSAVATTLWTSDALTLTSREGPLTVFQLWYDSFVHARQISEFSHGQGFESLSDIRMAGVHPALYHYAAYAVPSVLVAITGTGALETFAGFLLPFGVMLTGFAAFSLGAFLWGPWSGLAATVGLLLLPDAYQQGLGNPYLAYNFMQQVNVGGMYGVAALSVAWILMLDACQRGKVSGIPASWMVGGLSVAYKAQLFVANAFLLLIYPFAFLVGLSRRRRVVLGSLVVLLFCAVVFLSQRVPGVPTIRLDGTGAPDYVSQLLRDYDPGVIKSFLHFVFFKAHLPRPLLGVCAVPMILISTFGAWLLAFAVVASVARRTIPRVILAFPILILLNYVVMSLGLAMDRTQIGTADELLNRPFVWAVFVIVVWTAGGAYALCFPSGLPKGRPARMALATAGLLSLFFPFFLSKNVQTFSTRPGYSTFRDQSSVPTCLVEAARHIRDRSQPTDIIQDSEADPKFMVTSLTERREYAVNYLLHKRPPAELEQRLAQLDRLKTLTDEREIHDFAASRQISWYILEPATRVQWPASLLEQSQFSCGGVRVYRFAPSTGRGSKLS